jgi:hypothetical protein
VKRLTELEHENGRLTRLYADLSLENATACVQRRESATARCASTGANC